MKSDLKLIAACHLLSAICLSAYAQGTAFTYQGRLFDNTNAANGNYALRFTLYPDATNGMPALAGPLTDAPIAVSNGLFTVTLDFGPGWFTGPPRWLQIESATNSANPLYLPMTPRQQLTPAPYAIFANTASNLSGTLPTAQLAGTVANSQLASNTITINAGAGLSGGGVVPLGSSTTLTIPAGGVSNAMLAHPSLTVSPGAGLSGGGSVALGASTTLTNTGVLSVTGNSDITASPTSGNVVLGDNATSSNIVSTIVKRDGSGNFSAGTITGNGSGLTNVNAATVNGLTASNFWRTTGNSGTTPGVNFLGTTDNQPLELWANGNRALRLEPGSGGSPNVIGGSANNSVTPGIGGATIGGGVGNTASRANATIGGGQQNTANGLGSTIPGGVANVAAGDYSFAAGNRAKALNQGSFVWADSQVADFSSTANDQFLVRAQNGVTLNAENVSGGGVTLNGAAGIFLNGGAGTVQAQANNVSLIGPSGGTVTLNSGTVSLTAATGGVNVDPSTSLNFGSQTRQMLNLWGSGTNDYGIGVQDDAMYFRTAANVGGYWWYQGGVHSDTGGDPGGGYPLMELIASGHLVVHGDITGNYNFPSDRNIKENFTPIDPLGVLAKVAALPITGWNFTNKPAVKHIGPMAQDWYATFNIGPDDKHIAVVDEGGVALAAIQGLNQKLEAGLKAKDARITQLENELSDLKSAQRQTTAEWDARFEALQKRMARVTDEPESTLAAASATPGEK